MGKKKVVIELPPRAHLYERGAIIARMRLDSRRRVGRDVSLVLRGRWPLSCVNPTVLPRSPLERWQPYPMERGPNR